MCIRRWKSLFFIIYLCFHEELIHVLVLTFKTPTFMVLLQNSSNYRSFVLTLPAKLHSLVSVINAGAFQFESVANNHWKQKKKEKKDNCHSRSLASHVVKLPWCPCDNQGKKWNKSQKSGQKILYWQQCGYVICDDAGFFFSFSLSFKYVEA